MNFRLKTGAVAFGIAAFAALSASADSISPETYEDTLAVGESVTIEKTVVVSAGTPTTSKVDVMFLFDTTGSMSGQIANAKANASSILTALGSLGDVATGVAFYDDVTDPFGPDLAPDGTSEPVLGSDFGIRSALSTSDADTIAGLNTLSAGGGGDGPEEGNAGIEYLASSADTGWRPGSKRFIVALGDASFKTPPSDADTMAALAAADVSLLGISFGSGFATSITELGGTVFSAGSAAATAATITSAVTTSFDTYSTVSIDDFGAGLPGIDVSVVCTGADSGSCVGDSATGAYDRSVERTFTFDVTFERLAAGLTVFDTHALVDGGIVASELDTFRDVSAVPLPAGVWLLGTALAGLGISRRRRKAA